VATSLPPKPPIKGTRFGKYTLLQRIAVGGMAEIFLARQEGLEGFEKMICIKRIRPHLSSQVSFVRMFLNEAKLAAQLNHPNIVQIYDLGRIGESYFIAMEYITGRDMSRCIPKAEKMGIQFPLVYALKVTSSICEGLYFAHNRTDAYGKPLNIVHRDITPENVMVSFNGVVKILDFGIAKATSQIEQTRAGEIKGKLSYMSPEQCMGKQVDQRSDIFALGVVTYEWITGYKLFTGENEMAILKCIIDGKIYPPGYFKEDVPEPVERILMKCLEKDREKRYQSAWDLQYDIDQFLASQEFAPSNIHLANFMKQLFSDEVEQEQGMLQRAAQTEHQSEEAVVEPEEVGAEPLEDSKSHDLGVLERAAERMPAAHRPTQVSRTGTKLDAELRLHLTRGEVDQLDEMARKKGLPTDLMVREMVRSFMRWL
jgi:serine/threonine-protein kinase